VPVDLIDAGNLLLPPGNPEHAWVFKFKAPVSLA